MSALEERARLKAREERIGRLMWQPHISAARRETLRVVRTRIWREMRENASAASLEQWELEWPNGLPAHP